MADGQATRETAVAAGPAAIEALAAAVSDAKAGDPLAPVTVIAPGNVPRLTIRRALGRSGRGIANVDVTTLRDLGAAYVAERGLEVMPAGIWEEATRLALEAEPGPFAPVASHPATTSRVADALRRLHAVPADERSAVASTSRRHAALVRLLGAVEQATRRWLDDHDIALRAAADADADPGRPVIAFAPSPTDAAQEALLSAVATHVIRTVVDAPLPTRIVVASDAETEARVAVRAVLAALERTPADRIAISPFGPATARARLAELLDSAGIAWSGGAPHTLASSVAGRVVLALLDLDSERWSLDAVIRLLASGPIRRNLDDDRTGTETAPTARWAALARSANVVAGPDQWRDRLAVLTREAAAHRDDGTAADARELAGFIASLHRRLHPDPVPVTWSTVSAWLLDLLDHVLVHSYERDFLATREGIIALGSLDALAGRPSREALRAAVARTLDRPASRHGVVGGGVLVASPRELVGATSGLLLVTGLVEGAAPRRSRDDALLVDTDRAVRRAEERTALLAAVASSTTSVVSTHRADHQSERRPSRWILEWAGRHAGLPEGVPVTARDLLAATGSCAPPHSTSWLTVVPSFAAAVTDPAHAATDQEAAVASIDEWRRAGHEVDSHFLFAGSRLARSVDCTRARRSDRFTIWDGLLERTLPFADPISATALETWAECPRRHFLRYVLRIAPTEHPEDQLGLDGLERGSLAHEALHHVVRRRLGAEPPKPGEPWDDLDHAVLRRAVREGADRRRRDGRIGTGIIADLRQDELLASLLNILSDDDVVRAEDGWIPMAAELDFDDVPVSLPASGTVHFRGRIDRLDRSEDGTRARVIDYKTGQGNRQIQARRNGPAAARLLQLSVYERAVRHLHPGITEVDAVWWLVDRRPEPMLVPNALTDELFEAAVDAIVSGIRGGVFPADPGEDRGTSWSSCTYCAYDRICATDRDDAIDRKLADPALAPFVTLRGVGEAVAGDQGSSDG